MSRTRFSFAGAHAIVTGGSAGIGLAVAERLAPHGLVIAPDLRGHGDSDQVGPGGYYYFADYVADLDDAIVRGAIVPDAKEVQP